MCSLTLAALAATGLFVVSPANLALALVFVFVSVATSALYVARLWRQALPASPYGYWWFFLNDFLHPKRVRENYAAMTETPTDVAA